FSQADAHVKELVAKKSVVKRKYSRVTPAYGSKMDRENVKTIQNLYFLIEYKILLSFNITYRHSPRTPWFTNSFVRYDAEMHQKFIYEFEYFGGVPKRWRNRNFDWTARPEK